MPRSNPELAASMGMRMSARRRELGLTQEMVAELAGIAHQQYNKAENGRYDECIEICDMGIRIARATGRCPLLGETLFNRAWALIQRNRAGDIDVAKKTLKDAIYFSCAIDNQQNIETMQDFYRKTFGESILV